MKLPGAIFLLLMSTIVSAQDNSEKFKTEISKSSYINTKDVKNELLSFDIGPLLTRTNNPSVMGFIGSEYQRIRMKFVSVIKNKAVNDQYFIYGKSMVKDNVCEFQGTLKITAAYYLKESDGDVKQGIIIGDYILYENPSQKHVGEFKGSFKTEFYIDKQGIIQYDDLSGDADGFSNNEFVGTWTSYGGKISKPCNWGDHRIPMSGDLDSGSGEFVPDPKYIANGWLNYKQAYFDPQNKLAEEARKKENSEWWK